MMKRYKLGLTVAITAMVIGGLSFAATQTEWLKGAFIPGLVDPSALNVVGTGNETLDIDWTGNTAYELGHWKTEVSNQMIAGGGIFTIGTDELAVRNMVHQYFQDLQIRVLTMEGPAVLPYPLETDIGMLPEFDVRWTLVGSPIPDKQDEFEAAGLQGSEVYFFIQGNAAPEGSPPINFQDGDFSGDKLGEEEPIYCGSFEITSPKEGEIQQGEAFETTVTLNAKNQDSTPYEGPVFYTSTDPGATFNGQVTPVTISSTSVEYVGSESATIEVSAPGDTDPDQNCLTHVNFELQSYAKPASRDFLTVTEIGSTSVEIDWDSDTSYVLGKWDITASKDAEVEAAILNIGSLQEALNNRAAGYPPKYFENLTLTASSRTEVKVYDFLYGGDYPLVANSVSHWVLKGEPIKDKEDEFIAAKLEGKKIYGLFTAVASDGTGQDQGSSAGGTTLKILADGEVPVVVEEEELPVEEEEEIPVVVEEEVNEEVTNVYNTYYYDEETDEDEGLDEDTVEILTSDDYVCGDPFTDTNSLEETLEDLICRNYEANIVDGRDPDHYKPFEYITRAEFLKITLRSAGYLTSDADGLSESFADVDGDDWFLPYVVIGYSEGYIVGDGQNFRPNDPITRADAVMIGMRVSGEALNDDDNPFGDINGDEYYADAVITAGNTTVDVPGEGEQTVVGGFDDGDFHPMDFISRGDAAALVNRMAIAFFLEEIAESLE